MSKKKVIIDYLQFLNKPELDESIMTYFFTYLEPRGDKTIRFSDKSKKIVSKKYRELFLRFTKLNKNKKANIKTTTKIDSTKKIKNKFNIAINNKLVITEIQTKALELKIEGFHYLQVIEELQKVYPDVTNDVCAKAATWAYEELAKDVDDEYIRLTIFKHGQAYDDLYKKFIDLTSPKLAMRALKAKETLNNIGTDIFEIQINNVFESSEELISYGMNQLDESEQKELISILSKIGA